MGDSYIPLLQVTVHVTAQSAYSAKKVVDFPPKWKTGWIDCSLAFSASFSDLCDFLVFPLLNQKIGFHYGVIVP